MLNGDGKEICEIINSLISDKKTTLHVQHTFFVHFFAVTLHGHDVKLSSYTFYGKKMSNALTKDIFACFPVRFFFHCSPLIIFTLLSSPC